MAIKIAHASIDENGKIAGGKAGDQTKREVCVREWWNKPWNVMIRAIDPVVAMKIAQTAEAITVNDNIGYNQGTAKSKYAERVTLFNEASKVNHNIAKITKPCECDCSSFTSECVIAAGVKVSPALTTMGLRKGLTETSKFKAYTESKYLTTDENLKRGDILIKEGSHVVVVLEDGKKNVSKYTQKQFITDVCKILEVKTALEALKKTITISEKKNKTHALVTPLERYLKSIGYYTGTIEADLGKKPTFGRNCTTAVNRYQKEVLKYTKLDGEITTQGNMWKSLLGL